MKATAPSTLSVFAAALFGVAPAVPAQAQDASFGCKVLLCAAAQSPPWSAIPYCVPPMNQLFRLLKKGGSWPVCAEGNASPVGYDPYAACPAGTLAVSASSDAVRPNYAGSTGAAPISLGAPLVENSGGALCANPDSVLLCSAGQGCTFTAATPSGRPLNADPYYVDIATGGRQQRFRFSLQ